MNDLIKIEKDILYLNFSKTGKRANINVIPFTQFMSLYSRDNELCIHNGYKTIVIELFEDITQTKKIEAYIKKKLRWYLVKEGIKKRLRRVFFYGVLPFFLFFFLLTIYSLVNIFPPNQSLQLSDKKETIVEASSEELLANALKIGAETHSIQLSNGKKGALYIFSDPLCPYCRQLEPELEELGKDYSIFLFPVTVISGDSVIKEVSNIFCRPKTEQSALWKSLIVQDYTVLTSITCNTNIIQTNNTFFKKMGFIGTPMIINHTGSLVPDYIANTASAVKEWMKSYEQ